MNQRLCSLLIFSRLSMTTLGWVVIPHVTTRSNKEVASTLSFVPGHIPDEILRGRHPLDDPDAITHTDVDKKELEANLEQAYLDFQQQEQQDGFDLPYSHKVPYMMGSWSQSRHDPSLVAHEDEDCEHAYFDQMTGDALCWGLFGDDTLDPQALNDAMNSLNAAQEGPDLLVEEEEEDCEHTYYDETGDALCWVI